jgi:hypothetical protein
VSLSEALEAVRAAGATLVLDGQGPLLRGRVDSPVVEVLRQHKDQLVAALRLREVHRAMGFDEADIRLIEEALLSGKVNAVTIVPAPAGGRVA